MVFVAPDFGFGVFFDPSVMYVRCALQAINWGFATPSVEQVLQARTTHFDSGLLADGTPPLRPALAIPSRLER